MSEQYARGPNYVYARDYVQQTYGEETWKKVLAAMPPESAGIWNGVLLPGNCYSFAAFKDFTRTLKTVIGPRSQQETSRIYEFIADRSLNAIYKMFFHFSKPSFVIKNYPKLWVRFFTIGTVTVPAAEAGHAVITFELPEIFLDWLDDACHGFSRKAVEMAGGKNLSLKQTGKSNGKLGQWQVTYDLTWKE